MCDKKQKNVDAETTLKMKNQRRANKGEISIISYLFPCELGWGSNPTMASWSGIEILAASATDDHGYMRRCSHKLVYRNCIHLYTCF